MKKQRSREPKRVREIRVQTSVQFFGETHVITSTAPNPFDSEAYAIRDAYMRFHADAIRGLTDWRKNSE